MKTKDEKGFPHISVMRDEVLDSYKDMQLKVFYDGTLGAGGHAEAILEAHPEIEIYIGCDQDKSALEIAKQRLSKYSDKMRFVHGNFSDLDKHLLDLRIEEVDGFFLT
ncbi:MAG: Ribosomal RNA small subunit methyltransferase H [Chlamydiia bacterium]|nr:Ribosomal RNA small subunit methyltransferase H [Chlamydiia bacterium]